MIIRDTPERFDGVRRLVQYDVNAQGACTTSLTPGIIDHHMSEYFEQRAKVLARCKKRLLAGEISAIGFFMEIEHLTVAETAARMQMRQGTVRKHMTPRGFESVRVETLKAYATLFDISLADFFQFAVLGPGVQAEVTHFRDRVIEELSIKSRS